MPIDGFPVTVQTPRQESAVLTWLVDNNYCRQGVTIMNSGGGSDLVLEVGTVMGQISVGASATYAANAGNTGNFTCGTVTVAAVAIEGVYQIEFIAATVFNVFDPLGNRVGEGHTGAAFAAGQLSFTITAGGTAAAAGDGATITLAVNSSAGLYVPLNLSAADGSENAAAVLLQRAFVAAGTNDSGNILARGPAVVRDAGLIWPSGATGTQIAAAEVQLAAVGIITKPSV